MDSLIIESLNLKIKILCLEFFVGPNVLTVQENDIPVAFYKEEEIEENLEIIFINKLFLFLMNFLVPAYTMLVLSFFVRFFSKPSKKLKYISDSAYWIYIIHLPLSFFIPAFFHQSNIHYIFQFFISSVIVTIICFLSYHYFVRKTFLGKFLNGKKFE